MGNIISDKEMLSYAKEIFVNIGRIINDYEETGEFEEERIKDFVKKVDNFKSIYESQFGINLDTIDTMTKRDVITEPNLSQMCATLGDYIDYIEFAHEDGFTDMILERFFEESEDFIEYYYGNQNIELEEGECER